ncbi:Multidrug resistance-associated protein 6, partial [Chytriomyces hyalinus]
MVKGPERLSPSTSIRYDAESSGLNPPPLYMGLIYTFGLFLINMTASTLYQGNCLQQVHARCSHGSNVANVDLETDHQIQNTLRTTMRDATIFTIAHRLNTVIDSDRILVLDGGNIAEFGSPAALLAQDGVDGRPLSMFAAM